MLDEPASATALAQRLGTTRQKVNYHLRTLEEAGFVELFETRQRRGLEERLMRRTSDVVLVDPLAFDSSGLTRDDVVGLSGVVASAADVIRDAAAVTAGARKDGSHVAASALEAEIRVAGPSALRQLLDDLAELIASYDSDQGLRVKVTNLVLPRHQADD